MGPKGHSEYQRPKGSELASHPADEQFIALDDVIGTMFNPELVRNPRKAEMEYSEKDRVREGPGVSERYKAIGNGPIGVRWIDVDEQTRDPFYLSRLVHAAFL